MSLSLVIVLFALLSNGSNIRISISINKILIIIKTCIFYCTDYKNCENPS